MSGAPDHEPREAEATRDPDAALKARSRPKRAGLFRHDARITIAWVSMTSSLIGLGALSVEVGVARAFGLGALGTFGGLPIPFVSAPLGLGGLLIALSLMRGGAREIALPIAVNALYWGAVFAALRFELIS